MNSIENKTQSAVKLNASEPIVAPTLKNKIPQIEEVEPEIEQEPVPIEDKKVTKSESTETKIRRSFFDKYVDKIKDFLDNAE
jgi:cell division protein FtsA